MPFVPTPHQHLTCPIFVITVILVGVKWSLIVFLMCTSPVTNDAASFLYFFDILSE